MTDDPKQEVNNLDETTEVTNGAPQEAPAQPSMNRRSMIRGAATVIGAGLVAGAASKVFGAEKGAPEVRGRILNHVRASMNQMSPVDEASPGYDKSDGGHSRYVKL